MIKRLTNKKAPESYRISSEMLQVGGIELPSDWKEAIIVPIDKKGDKEEQQNYRGISLLNT